MLKRLIPVFVVFGFVFAKSPAPIYDRPSDFKPVPERSQDEVAKEQLMQRTQGEVGQVEADTTPESAAHEMSEQQAAADLSSANSGRETLINAESDLKSAKSKPQRNLMWGLLFLALGFGVVLGIRQWANRAIPYPESTPRIK